MALTDEQKSQVRLYLGYPDGNRQLHAGLEGAMDALSAAGETRVGELLTALASVDSTLTSSWARQKVVKAEEVTLAGDGEIRALRQEGRRLVGRLAATLGVDVRHNTFGSGPSHGIARRG